MIAKGSIPSTCLKSRGRYVCLYFILYEICIDCDCLVTHCVLSYHYCPLELEITV